MKTLKKAAAALALLLVWGVFFSNTSAAASSALITEAGTISDSRGDIKFRSGYLCTRSGEEMTLLDPSGTPVKEGTALDIKEKNGYMILTKKGNPVAQSAVLTADGKTVIPYGPALVEPLNEQFWLATFAVKETKNKEEAMIYSTDQLFSLQPKEGDTLYTGRRVVYDVTSGKEVPGIEILTKKGKIEALGSSLLVTADDGSKKIYDKDGQVREADASSIKIIGGFYVGDANGTSVVFDSEGNRLFETNHYLSGVDSSGEYLSYKNDSNHPVLVNSNGEDILEMKKKGHFGLPSLRYDLDPEDGQGLLTFSNFETDKGLKSLISSDGTEICKEIYTTICYEGAGYYYGSRKAGSNQVYDVFDSQGNLMGEKLNNFGTSDMIAYKENKVSGSRKYYIYDKKDYTLEQKSAQSIGFGLLKVKDEKSDKYGLYDVFSGNQILKTEYANIYYAYNNIYAYKDGVYTIYNVKR